jgi:hypothetical protein
MQLEKGQFKTVKELEEYMAQFIEGSFGQEDMEVLKYEVEKLKPGQVYLEIGVAQGKSLTTAYHFSKPGVFTIGIDYLDPTLRGEFMNMTLGDIPHGNSIIGKGTDCIYIHADARTVSKLWNIPINLLFIDGGHDYESIKADTLEYMPHVVKGGTILLHDYDGQNADGVPKWIDEKFPHAEILHGKIARVRCE